MGRAGRQEGYDPLPERIGHAPLIVTNSGSRRLRGGRDHGHEWISWWKLKYQEILRISTTGIGSNSTPLGSDADYKCVHDIDFRNPLTCQGFHSVAWMQFFAIVDLVH